MSDLERGAIVRLRNIRHYPDPTLGTGILEESWTAPKDHVFIAVVLGVERKDGTEHLDVEAEFREMGWELREGLSLDAS